MKFNDKTKEIFISQYDYGIPIVFTAKSGFVDGDIIIFTFDNENILNKEYTVELEDNTFTFSLAFTQAEAETILSAKLDSCFTIRYSVKHKRGNEFVDSLINSKLVVNSSVPIESKRNYLVELENENRALKNTIESINNDIAAAYSVCERKDADLPTVRNSANLPETINSIQINPDYALILYDYDGTVVHAYTEAKTLALTELPPQPVHDGLTATGWAWPLSAIKDVVRDGGELCVGSFYTTSDGKTRLYIRLNEGQTEFSFTFVQPTAYIDWNPVGVTDYAYINWGDGYSGYTTDTVSGNYGHRTTYKASHSYSPASYPAEYVIEITPPPGDLSFGFGGNASSLGMFYDCGDSAQLLYKIELSESDSLGKFCFEGAINLESVTGNRSFRDYSLSKCFSLRAITAGILGDHSCENCYSLEYACIAYGNYTVLNAHAVDNCKKLKRYTGLEHAVTLSGYAFYGCGDRVFKDRLVIPDTVTSIGSYCGFLSGLTLVSSIVLRVPPTCTIASGAFSMDVSYLEEVDLTYYTDPSMIPVLQASVMSILPTRNVFGEVPGLVVASEDMKTAFMNATNWNTGADYYIVKGDLT